MLVPYRVAAARVSANLERSSATRRTSYVGSCVFFAWFFCYGLRKPYSAAAYRAVGDGAAVLGLAPKDAISMGQTVGYMAGKLIASTVVPRLSRRVRLPLLLALARRRRTRGRFRRSRWCRQGENRYVPSALLLLLLLPLLLLPLV
eukprot:SAG31_NODE_19497_length_600_cov_0.910180_1_plen_145_part_01